MTNNKQQTAVEKFIEKLEELGDLRDCTSIGLIQLNIDKKEYIELKREAKEMEKEQREAYKYTEQDLRNAFNAGLMNRYSRIGEAVAEEEFIKNIRR